jgi:small subunit ribosomal protein S18
LVKENPSSRSRRTDPVPKRAKKNMFKTLGVTEIDYKDTAALRLFISDRGKIRARSVTGLTVHQQRQVATAIKNAREMALLPYSPGSR